MEKEKSRTAAVMTSGKSKSKKSKTPKKKGSGKRIKMHIRHADSGGYIAQHLDDGPETGTQSGNSSEHILPDLEALKQHVDDHMQQPEPEGEGQEPQPQQAV